MKKKNDVQSFDGIAALLRQVADCHRRIGDQCPMAPSEEVDWRYVLKQLGYSKKYLEAAHAKALEIFAARKTQEAFPESEQLPQAEPVSAFDEKEVDRG